MGRVYHYVGPKAILDRQGDTPLGLLVNGPADVLRWRDMADQDVCGKNEYVATFVVDESNQLRIAHRRSEHVACSGGAAVHSAGELAFLIETERVEVSWVTNQSTGYCPEPESWPAVQNALSIAGMNPPDEFTRAFEFRRCEQCSSINVIKNSSFQCGVCEAAVPRNWNFLNDVPYVRIKNDSAKIEQSETDSH